MSSSLKVGQLAPHFELTDVLDKSVTLFNPKHHFSLVVFFRYSGCPWCNLAVHRLSLEYSALQKNGCQVIAFIQSDTKNILENIYQRHTKKPGFPIIADPTKKIYSLYGVRSSKVAGIKSITKIPHWVHSVRKHGFKQTEIDGDAFMVPASFLINNLSKKIVKVHYSTDFYDTDSFIDIYESLLFGEG